MVSRNAMEVLSKRAAQLLEQNILTTEEATKHALARIHRSETSVSLTPWMMGKGRRTGLARSQ